MDRKDKLEFALDYIRFLIDTQAGVDELYASICYGGVVYDDKRINLYDVFYVDNLKLQDLHKVVAECSSEIGDIMQYLEERDEKELLDDEKELVCYIQIASDIWDALYGESDGEIAEYLTTEFEDFLDSHDMEYELTTYGRNAVFIYKREATDEI
ncbi:MAG: hypothetical protein IKW90_01880 [Lachnospiraceae bacterium]|nr:hypothetical protein [Lachnospiraceae bacterium]